MRHYFQPTQDQIDQVQGWLYDGLSMSQIGRRLGVSRNVVSGVIWRRPTLREIQRQRFGSSTLARIPKPVNIITKFIDSGVPQMMANEPERPSAQLPAKEGVILNDLGVAMCKYPLAWDDYAIGGWRFCGKRTKPDDVYCNKHKLIVRQKRSEDQP